MERNESRAKGSNSPTINKKWIYENVLSLGFAVLLVFMIRSSIVEAFKIPSGSMVPTLLVGDHIFVNKFAYGVKLPFTDWFMENPIYLMHRDGPKRGDVIVFKFPKDMSTYYIKRVVGTPGDTIEMRDKVLYVNDQPVDRTLISSEEKIRILRDVDADQYDVKSLEVYREALKEDPPTIMIDRNSLTLQRYGPITVPEGKYFVMGDNRDYSNDSRFWGFVPFDNIMGRAMVIWLSAWLDFSEGNYTFRPSRIGTVLK